jgi:hypothetical protein
MLQSQDWPTLQPTATGECELYPRLQHANVRTPTERALHCGASSQLMSWRNSGQGGFQDAETGLPPERPEKLARVA